MKTKKFIMLCVVVSAFGCHRRESNVNSVTKKALFANRNVVYKDNQAVEYSPAARLRKLSISLRGFPPALSEYQLLDQAVKAGTAKTYFAQTTALYLKSPQHVGKMVQRLDELFRVRSSRAIPEFRLLFPVPENGLPFPGAETFNSMDLLFAEMAASNLPWDELLISKHYTIPKTAPLASFPLSIANDRAFFAKLMPIGTPLVMKPAAERIEFSPNDNRIAGAISTARFLNRYNTTVLNRGRGRAAAMFRIFLCDPMSAVVVPKKDEDEALLKKAFPQAPSEEPNFSSYSSHDDISDDPHGQDAACMACHYKLDPMGKTFMNIGSTMPPEPASGKLVYRRENGEMVQLGVEGLGALGAAIVSQPEYAQCQVKHFWRWFIRGDQQPSTARLNELVAEFNRLGRKTNDFISYLTETPEFLQDPGSLFASDVTLLQLRPILNQCSSCHQGYPAKKIPHFSQFPIGGTENHKHWIERIAIRLDLAHNGAKKSMPPEDSTWDLSAEEIRLIKEWVGNGAKDESGTNSIESSFGQSLIGGGN